MNFSKNTNIFLYAFNQVIHFFSYNDKVHYLFENTNEKICLYENTILEFDVDIDPTGNIGVVILDCEGKFFYYYYDGKTWTNHLLYEIDLDVEEFKYVSIKFSLHSPYILFCWRDLSSPHLWSIVAYYKENNDWKKEVLNRIYLKEIIKPYILIRNIDYDVHFIYLNNNNIIYDLIIKSLCTHSTEWSVPFFLSNCIFLKYFYIDAIIDSEGIIHISWIDKYKKNYCIKYIFIHIKDHTLSHLEQFLKMDIPLLHQQLLYHENAIYCYGLTKEHIYYFIKKKKSSHWIGPYTIKLFPESIHLIKIIQSSDPLSMQYNANYILSKNISPIALVSTTEIDPTLQKEETDSLESNSTIKEQENNSSHTQDIPLDVYKQLKMELYQKSQELEMKNHLVKSLEGNISFLKGEINRLSTQNKNYIDTIYSNDDKFKKYKQIISTLKNNYEKTLSDFKLCDEKNEVLINKITIYQNQLKEMQIHFDKLDKKNISLEKENTELKNMNLLKRLFH